MAETKNAGDNTFNGHQKGKDVRRSNILAAKGVADAVRTSLGPKGMDKMITTSTGDVVITNDGATILAKLEVVHPAAKMLVELSRAQDVEAGDGTTSVVVLCGSMLSYVQQLLDRGIHPSVIAESWKMASEKCEEVLVNKLAIPVDMDDNESLVKAAVTSLNSKVVSSNAPLLAPLAVDAVRRVVDLKAATSVDLRDIKVVKKVGGTVDDTELVEGLVFDQKASRAAGGPTRVQNAKIGLIQFQLSAPKADMDSSVVVSDYQQMDRILKEERKYILKMVKAIAKTGCNVLLIQKSILRDAVNDLSLHFLAKKKIMLIKDVEREDVEFVSKSLGLTPVAHPDMFNVSKLGSAALVEEVPTGQSKVVKITGVKNPGKTVSILCRGANRLLVDETERSVHDALCVVRCLVKNKFLIPGGAAPEIELSLELAKWADTLSGVHSICVRAFADALEVVPYTLAENAGLHPIEIVTALRKAHAAGHTSAGINVRRSTVTDMIEENVLQPLLVSASAVKLASETVRMLLKIDDIVGVR